jgi:hypothetical protein
VRAALLLAFASINAAHPASTSAAQPAAPADAFAQLESLAGDWQADLPGYGTMHDTVRLISNGTAIEEIASSSF